MEQLWRLEGEARRDRYISVGCGPRDRRCCTALGHSRRREYNGRHQNAGGLSVTTGCMDTGAGERQDAEGWYQSAGVCTGGRGDWMICRALATEDRLLEDRDGRWERTGGWGRVGRSGCGAMTVRSPNLLNSWQPFLSARFQGALLIITWRPPRPRYCSGLPHPALRKAFSSPSLSSSLSHRRPYGHHPSVLRRAHGHPRPRRPHRLLRAQPVCFPPLALVLAFLVYLALVGIFKHCTTSHQQYLFFRALPVPRNRRLVSRGLPREGRALRHSSVEGHHQILPVWVHRAFLNP